MMWEIPRLLVSLLCDSGDYQKESRSLHHHHEGGIILSDGTKVGPEIQLCAILHEPLTKVGVNELLKTEIVLEKVFTTQSGLDSNRTQMKKPEQNYLSLFDTFKRSKMTIHKNAVVRQRDFDE